MALYHFTTEENLSSILNENIIRASVAETFLDWSRVSMTVEDRLDRFMPKLEIRIKLNQELMKQDGIILTPMDYDQHFGQYSREKEIYCETDIINVKRYIEEIFDLYEEEILEIGGM